MDSFPFETNIQKSWLFGIVRIRPIHSKMFFPIPTDSIKKLRYGFYLETYIFVSAKSKFKSNQI